MDAMSDMSEILNHWWLVGLWALVAGTCLFVLFRDLAHRNTEIAGLMKLVWIFTVANSGPLGLWIYWNSGRKQIPRDGIWRRGARSVAHCYAGCGIGEIAGIVIAAGVLSLGTWWVAGTTFCLAYLSGVALTVGPMMQEGTGFKRAMLDAVYAETPTITVMEVVAISTDVLLAGSATMADALFWSSLVVSLTAGLVAAYPVNVLLIRVGVKEGMHDPRDMAGET